MKYKFSKQLVHEFEVYQQATGAFGNLLLEVQRFMEEDSKDTQMAFYRHLKSLGKKNSEKMLTKVSKKEIQEFLGE